MALGIDVYRDTEILGMEGREGHGDTSLIAQLRDAGR
jgi:hypothetical protein